MPPENFELMVQINVILFNSWATALGASQVINIVKLIVFGSLGIGLIGVIKSVALNEPGAKKKLFAWIGAVAVFYVAITLINI